MSQPAHVPPSVRLALPVEAPRIAALQRAVWAGDDLTRRWLDEVSEDDLAEVWHRAIVRPPLAHCRVLVATHGAGESASVDGGGVRQPTEVVAFAAVQPSDDDDAAERDALVAEFCCPAGLGDDADRLLHAVVDTLRADGYQRATWWLRSDDDALRAWLTEVGWAPDGAHRELTTDDGTARVKQVRLHTDIS